MKTQNYSFELFMNGCSVFYDEGIVAHSREGALAKSLMRYTEVDASVLDMTEADKHDIEEVLKCFVVYLAQDDVDVENNTFCFANMRAIDMSLSDDDNQHFALHYDDRNDYQSDERVSKLNHYRLLATDATHSNAYLWVDEIEANSIEAAIRQFTKRLDPNLEVNKDDDKDVLEKTAEALKESYRVSYDRCYAETDAFDNEYSKDGMFDFTIIEVPLTF